MKRIAKMMWLLSCLVYLAQTDCPANPANANFELPSFAGWQLDISRGNSSFQPGNRRAGTAETLTNWGQTSESQPIRVAINGERFATIGSLVMGNFIGNRTYQVSLSQTFSLSAGDALSGWASFYNGDYAPQDSAWVRISNCEFEIIATPWRENSGSQSDRDSNSTEYRTFTPWTQWFWQAPEDGTYTLSMGVTTKGDNNFASYGFFDDILVSPPTLLTVVPEPTSFTLLVAGAIGLAMRHKFKSRR